jgi:hypothetical protein
MRRFAVIVLLPVGLALLDAQPASAAGAVKAETAAEKTDDEAPRTDRDRQQGYDQLGAVP